MKIEYGADLGIARIMRRLRAGSVVIITLILRSISSGASVGKSALL